MICPSGCRQLVYLSSFVYPFRCFRFSCYIYFINIIVRVNSTGGRISPKIQKTRLFLILDYTIPWSSFKTIYILSQIKYELIWSWGVVDGESLNDHDMDLLKSNYEKLYWSIWEIHKTSWIVTIITSIEFCFRISVYFLFSSSFFSPFYFSFHFI